MDFQREQAKLKEAGNAIEMWRYPDWLDIGLSLKKALKVVKSATVLAKIIKNIKGHM